MFKTIKENISAEIVEKKSKFIANMFYIQSVEEAENILKQVKKKFYDAKHNCFAYSVSTTEGIIKKSSDDGAPAVPLGSPSSLDFFIIPSVVDTEYAKQLCFAS